MWKDATYDVFESRGILPVSDWSQEYCFVGIRESFVAQLLVQGSNWGWRSERLSEEERDATWKRFLMDCGANLTSPGLSVYSGALVLVLICVHGRVRFDLVVQMDFSFIVCPLVIILMFLIVIVQLSGS